MPKLFSLPPRRDAADSCRQKQNGLRRRAGRRSQELREVRAFDADKQEIARLAGVAFVPVLAGPHGRADWGYAYPEPLLAEVASGGERAPLVVERDAVSGFYTIVR